MTILAKTYEGHPPEAAANNVCSPDGQLPDGTACDQSFTNAENFGLTTEDSSYQASADSNTRPDLVAIGGAGQTLIPWDKITDKFLASIVGLLGLTYAYGVVSNPVAVKQQQSEAHSEALVIGANTAVCPSEFFGSHSVPTCDTGVVEDMC